MKDEVSFGQALERINAPVEVEVSEEHPLLMPSQTEDRSKYLKLESPQTDPQHEQPVVRVKDNPLARDVLSSRQVNILDERISLSAANMADMSLVNTGSIRSSQTLRWPRSAWARSRCSRRARSASKTSM